MKYEGAYRSCETLETLKLMVERDIKMAIILNPDIISVIEENMRGL